MSKSEPAANRSIDLDRVRPVALDGGTAILARTYRTTSFGAEIAAGEIPVATSGVCSPTDLRHALAERQAGNAEVLA